MLLICSYVFLFFTTWYIRTPAATDALRELIFPNIGKLIIASHFFATNLPMPFPSLPITMAQGML